MKKTLLLISVVTIVSTETALAMPAMHDSNYFSKVKNKNCSVWDSENLIEPTDKTVLFAKSVKHCLQQRNKFKLSANQTRTEFHEMYQRFYESYDTLSSTENKVKFTLLFIENASKIQSVSVAPTPDGAYSLAFSYLTNSGKISSHLLDIMSAKDGEHFPTEQDFKEHSENNQGFHKYNALVDYVIHGKSKIH